MRGHVILLASPTLDQFAYRLQRAFDDAGAETLLICDDVVGGHAKLTSFSFTAAVVDCRVAPSVLTWSISRRIPMLTFGERPLAHVHGPFVQMPASIDVIVAAAQELLDFRAAQP
jgi:hypothetical protein